MRKVAFVGVVVAVLATSAAGQDAVEIKFDKPKVGNRVKVTVEEKSEGKTTVTIKGNVQSKTETKGKSLVYVDETLAVADGALKPTKLKRTYETAKTSTDGKSTALPVEGETVLIEKKGEKYTFTIDGIAVAGDAGKLLEAEFNKPDKEDPRALMLPNKPVKPGDTWKIDTDKLAKGLGDANLKLDKSKFEASGKLVRAYKVGNAQYGELELKFGAPITEPAKPPLKTMEGSLSVTLTGAGCIDGTSPAGTSKAVTKFSITGSGDGVDVASTATTTETRTTESLKK